MKVCILGSGLTSLTLAKTLINQGIFVDIFPSKKIFKRDSNRTLGISKINLDFFNKEVLNIEKLGWDIKKIEIFSENLNHEKILNFENDNKNLFSILRNDDLVDLLLKKLKRENLFKFKKKLEKIDVIRKKYNLIFNCDNSNLIAKKFFFKQIKKDYDSFAYISIIKHLKVKNNKATQIFTKNGPLAFLPLSETETSVVYSVKGIEKINFEYFIKKYNINYKIKKISDASKFKLNSSNLRTYYKNNILAFGDILHKVHPLAGQGFNMILRDIKEILNLIKLKQDNGLVIDSSICADFEKKSRNKNYLFSNGIDLIYEFFNLENKMNNNVLSKSIKLFGRNQDIKKTFIKIADRGIIF